jgi:cytochrome c oxidase subunit 2
MSLDRRFVREVVGIAVVIATVTTAGLTLAGRGAKPPATQLTAARDTVASSSPEARGARLFEAKGCVACHSVDGSARVGPSLLHAFGTTVLLDSGTQVAMDEAYIRESVLFPRAKSRPGYPAAMPSFDGVIAAHDLDAIVAYIRSLQ